MKMPVLGRIEWFAIIAVSLFVAVVAYGFWFSEGHGANLNRVARIEIGMTKDEVFDLLGTPSHITDHQWDYQRGTWCAISLSFDSQERVTYFEHDH